MELEEDRRRENVLWIKVILAFHDRYTDYAKTLTFKASREITLKRESDVLLYYQKKLYIILYYYIILNIINMR